MEEDNPTTKLTSLPLGPLPGVVGLIKGIWNSWKKQFALFFLKKEEKKKLSFLVRIWCKAILF